MTAAAGNSTRRRSIGCWQSFFVVLVMVGGSTTFTTIPCRREWCSRRITRMIAAHDGDNNNQGQEGKGNTKQEKTKNNHQTADDFDYTALAQSVFVDDQRPIVLFDGVCNLCDATAGFFIDHDATAKLRFNSLQTKTAQALLLLHNSNTNHDGSSSNSSKSSHEQIVLVTPDQTYFGGEAVSQILIRLDPWPLRLFGRALGKTPEGLREPLYQVVSRNRHVLGVNDSCRLDFDGSLTSRFISDPVEIAEV